MTAVKDKPKLVEPKVFFRWPEKMQIGPLGYWRVGDVVTIDGDRYAVASVDPDGMATAWSEANLKRSVEAGDAKSTSEALRARVGSGTVGAGLTTCQVESCKRIRAIGEAARAADEES